LLRKLRFFLRFAHAFVLSLRAPRWSLFCVAPLRCATAFGREEPALDFLCAFKRVFVVAPLKLRSGLRGNANQSALNAGLRPNKPKSGLSGTPKGLLHPEITV
jgi:hypothetical protein